MTLIEGIIGSIIAAGIVALMITGYQTWFGQKIKSTQPVENGYFGPTELRRGTKAHAVGGTLKYLPKDHKIWLIVVDETKGKHWPQGFERVDHDANAGTWRGYVAVEGWHNVTIVVVLAPPTTQEYFNYFQRVGGMTKHEPLLGIPRECRRRDTVHVRVATASAKAP